MGFTVTVVKIVAIRLRDDIKSPEKISILNLFKVSHHRFFYLVFMFKL